MSKFKRFSILFLILVILLMLSGCFYERGFHGGYYHRNYHYNSFDGPYKTKYNGPKHYSNYNRGFCWR